MIYKYRFILSIDVDFLNDKLIAFTPKWGKFDGIKLLLFKLLKSNA